MNATPAVEARDEPWTYEELCTALGVDPAHHPELRGATFVDVANDPMATTPRSLFIPTRLDNQAAAIQVAFAHGAAAALSNAPESAFPAGSPVIRVDNPVRALGTLARAGRDRCTEIVGITGSVGKSTIHAMALDALGPLGRTHGVRGNFNLELWLNRVLAVTPPATDFGVFEIGTLGPGTVGPTAAIVRPTVGLVTAAKEAHGGRFAGPRELLREKLGLLDHLSGQAVAIMGRQVVEADQAGENLLAGKPVGRLITVGSDPGDTVRLDEVRLTSTHTVATVSVEGVAHEVKLPVGRPFAQNAAFTLAIGLAVGVHLEAVVAGLTTFTPPAKRIERFRVAVGGPGSRVAEVIDDSYNASPTSVRALLEVVGVRKSRRKVLVLGDMHELGPAEVDIHRGLVPDVLESGVDVLVSVGPLAAAVADDVDGEIEVHRFPNPVTAGQALRGVVEHGDLVAIKGSAAAGLRAILPGLAPDPGQRAAAGEWAIEDDVPSDRPRRKRVRRAPAPSSGAAAPAASNGGSPNAPPAAKGPVLWRYDELCRDLGLTPDPDDRLAGAEFTTIRITAQAADPGALFLPLVPPGAQPGHIEAALTRGARAALSSAPRSELPADAPIIPVKNVTTALDELAKLGRARASGDVVAVLRDTDFRPGKALLLAALSAGGAVHSGVGSDELYLRRIVAATPPGAQDIVVDVSGGGAGAIRRRAQVVRPTVAILSSEEEPAVALALIEELTGRSAAIVGPRHAGAVARGLPEGLEIVRVGAGDDAQVRLCDIRREGARRVLEVAVGGDPVEVSLGPGDRRAIDAALYALAAAHVLGRDLGPAVAALERSADAPPVIGQRIDVQGTGKVVEIIEDWVSAAGPSLRLLLRELSRRPGARRRILVLADPPADVADPPAAPIADAVLGTSPADEVEAANLDLVVTVGAAGARLMDELDSPAEVVAFDSPQAAAAALPELVAHGDLIALAAASGSQVWPLREALAPGVGSPKLAPSWRIERELAR
ncbi:MAG TPA: Mur ligase family protein [Solirubrobacteraceae bacterium]